MPPVSGCASARIHAHSVASLRFGSSGSVHPVHPSSDDAPSATSGRTAFEQCSPGRSGLGFDDHVFGLMAAQMLRQALGGSLVQLVCHDDDATLFNPPTGLLELVWTQVSAQQTVDDGLRRASRDRRTGALGAREL